MPESNSTPRFALSVVVVVSKSVAPVRRKAPNLALEGAAPRAESELIDNVPAPTMTEPESPELLAKVLTPESTNVPAPYLCNIPVPLMIPPSVNVPADVVMTRVAVSVVAAVPKFNDELFVPVYVKSALSAMLVRPAIVTDAPPGEVLSRTSAPLSAMLKAPAPSALALFNAKPP